MSERLLLASVVVVTSTDTGTDEAKSFFLLVARYLDLVHRSPPVFLAERLRLISCLVVLVLFSIQFGY